MQFNAPPPARMPVVGLDHVEDVEQDDDADRHAQQPKKNAAHVLNSLSLLCR
jgi:hypothetical protein